ncbi:hypothetical protein ScalyP_jg10581 [Parmales sp. scaly parma]|nr:hypothetical protein ScalyP_jg10581 [Parmales sp. scaly parma]
MSLLNRGVPTVAKVAVQFPFARHGGGGGGGGGGAVGLTSVAACPGRGLIFVGGMGGVVAVYRVSGGEAGGSSTTTGSSSSSVVRIGNGGSGQGNGSWGQGIEGSGSGTGRGHYYVTDMCVVDADVDVDSCGNGNGNGNAGAARASASASASASSGQQHQQHQQQHQQQQQPVQLVVGSSSGAVTFHDVVLDGGGSGSGSGSGNEGAHRAGAGVVGGGGGLRLVQRGTSVPFGGKEDGRGWIRSVSMLRANGNGYGNGHGNGHGRIGRAAGGRTARDLGYFSGGGGAKRGGGGGSGSGSGWGAGAGAGGKRNKGNEHECFKLFSGVETERGGQGEFVRLGGGGGRPMKISPTEIEERWEGVFERLDKDSGGEVDKYKDKDKNKEIDNNANKEKDKEKNYEEKHAVMEQRIKTLEDENRRWQAVNQKLLLKGKKK